MLIEMTTPMQQYQGNGNISVHNGDHRQSVAKFGIAGGIAYKDTLTAPGNQQSWRGSAGMPSVESETMRYRTPPTSANGHDLVELTCRVLARVHVLFAYRLSYLLPPLAPSSSPLGAGVALGRQRRYITVHGCGTS